MPMGTEAQRASIRRKAPQRVSDPAAGCAPSSASTQCHGRPALTREMKGHCTSQLTCTRSHTCAHVHVHTHLVLHLLQSAHGVPLPAPACKGLALTKQASHTPPRGPQAARAACLLLTSFLPQTGLETGTPGHS